MGMESQPPRRGFFQIGHPFFEEPFVRVGSKRLPDGGNRRGDFIARFRAELVALGVDQSLHVPAEVGCLPDLAREQPAEHHVSLPRLTVAPAKAAGDLVSSSNRPENEAGLSDDFLLRKVAPGATVMAVHGVVAEGQIMAGPDDKLAVFVEEQRGQTIRRILYANEVVYVAGIMVFQRRLFRVESV